MTVTVAIVGYSLAAIGFVGFLVNLIASLSQGRISEAVAVPWRASSRDQLRDAVLLHSARSPSQATLTTYLMFIICILLGAMIAAGTSRPPTEPTPPTMLVAVSLVAGLLEASLLLVTVPQRGVVQIATYSRRMLMAFLLVVTISYAASVATREATLQAIVSATTVVFLHVAANAWKSTQKYRARVLWDDEFVVIPDNEGLREPHCRLASWLWPLVRRGHVPLVALAWSMLTRTPRSKSDFKLAAVVEYHRHHYADSLALSNAGLTLFQSEVLESYRNLALARSGRLAEAIDGMRQLASTNSGSSYYNATLAYLLWTGGFTDEAVDAARRALALHVAQKGRVCIQTAFQLGLFLTEKNAARVASGGTIDPSLADEALFAIAEGRRVLRTIPSLRWGRRTGGAVHNLALSSLAVVHSDEPDTFDEVARFATRCFAHAVWREGHAASMLRLAVVHMVGNTTFSSARFHLRRLRWSFRNQPERLATTFGRQLSFVERLLNDTAGRACHLGPDILLLHLAASPPPSDAFVSEEDDVRALRARVSTWFSWSIRELFADPFDAIPPTVRDRLDRASRPPWMDGCLSTDGQPRTTPSPDPA